MVDSMIVVAVNEGADLPYTVLKQGCVEVHLDAAGPVAGLVARLLGVEPPGECALKRVKELEACVRDAGEQEARLFAALGLDAGTDHEMAVDVAAKGTGAIERVQEIRRECCDLLQLVSKVVETRRRLHVAEAKVARLRPCEAVVEAAMAGFSTSRAAADFLRAAAGLLAEGEIGSHRPRRPDMGDVVRAIADALDALPEATEPATCDECEQALP